MEPTLRHTTPDSTNNDVVTPLLQTTNRRAKIMAVPIASKTAKAPTTRFGCSRSGALSLSVPLAIITLATCTVAPTLAQAAPPPPSELSLSPNGQRPTLDGERGPKATDRLPGRFTAPTPKPKPKAKPKPKPKVIKPRKPRPSQRQTHTRARSLLVLVDVGQVSVPRTIVSLAANANNFPDLIGVSMDISLLRAATWRHAYGVRVGLLLPSVPAANWFSDAPGAKPPVYTDVDLVGLDIAFEYAYRRKVIGPLGFMMRGGLGIAVALGSVRRVETLPGCTPAQAATCPHWRRAGAQPNALPSPIWPALHATGGLFIELGGRFGAHVEAGLRDAPYVGVGISLRP